MKKLIYIGCLLVLSACTNSPQTAEETKKVVDEMLVELTPAQQKQAALRMGNPVSRDVQSAVRVNGTVDVPPQNLVSVSFPLGGYLKSTSLLPGMHIRKGEVIATMEDPSFIQLQQDYLVAKARLIYLEKDSKRQEQLNATKSASDKALEQAQSEYQSKKVEVRALAERLRLAGFKPESISEDNISRSVNMVSPIDGYVSKVLVNIGKYVNPADVLFELVNPSDLHLALRIFEKDLPLIEQGQKVRAHLVNSPDEIHEAEIILVGRNLDEQRSTEVHCHFNKAEHGLLPGMYMNAEVEVTRHKAITVPDDAVVRYGKQEYLFEAVSPQAFRMIPIQTGVSQDGYTEWRDASAADSARQIVVENAYAVLMKMKNTAEE